MLRCGYEPIVAANHVTHVHSIIIHHAGEVVGGHTVRLDNYEVRLVHGEFALREQRVLYILNLIFTRSRQHVDCLIATQTSSRTSPGSYLNRIPGFSPFLSREAASSLLSRL